MKYNFVKYVLSFLTAIILFGCSELEKDVTQPLPVKVHKEGILNPHSENFHGKLISNNNWDMKQCQQCHGGNYAGGMVGVSCANCHNQQAGPENCATCHGSETSPAPPKDLQGNNASTEAGVGAHQSHLIANTNYKNFSCAECHKVPGNLYEEGHIDTDEPAEVLMNNFTANVITNEPVTTEYDNTLNLFDPDPKYDFAAMKCSNTYCHGAFKNGNTENAPVWTNTDAAACGTCHGDPSRATLAEKALPKTTAEGGTHFNITTCSSCHGGVVDATLKIIDPSKHIDGKLNLYGSDIDY